MSTTKWLNAFALTGAAVAVGLVTFKNYEGEKEGRLLNVSYDPTREVYQEINSKFVAKFEAETQVSRKHVISTPVIGDRHSFFVFREGNSPKG